MSNAKGSDKNNKISSTPNKVTASSRSETKSISTENLRQTVQKAVAMPAAAVRAAMASARTGAAAVRVAYDVLSRLLTLVESGVVIDAKTLQLTKAAIDAVGITDDVSIVNLGKFHAQIVTLNDVLTRVVSFYRSYNDTTISQDQPAKTISKAPFADTASYTDARVFTVGKNFTEVLQSSDNFSKVVTFLRSKQDIIQTADAKTFAITKPKTDVVSLADTFPKLISKPRSDTFGLSDSDIINFGKNVSEILRGNDSRTLVFTKRVSDFLLVADQFLGESGVLVVSDSEVDLSAISDSLARIVSFVRFFQDVARPQENLSRVVNKPRTDRLTVNQQLTRVVSFNRVFNDTDTAVDVFSRIVNFVRAYSDTLTIPELPAKSLSKAPFSDTAQVAETFSKTMLFPRAAADIAASADAFSKLVQFSRSFNSGANTVDTADIIATIKQFNRAFSELQNVSDGFSKVVSYIRGKSDTSYLADNFSKVVSFVRSHSDSSSTVDNFSKIVSYVRSFSDTAGASETFSRVALYPRSLADVSRSADQITARVFSKVLADVIRVSDSMYFSSIIEPAAFPPADTQRITDSVRKIVSYVKTYADTAKAQDTDVITYNKIAGENVFNVWSDFNELQGTYELCQYYPDYRVEYLKLNETFAKNYSKRIGPFTYYYDATWTDFNELSLGADIDQEIAQEFWRQAYSLDHDLVTFTETFRKTVSYVRSYSDTAAGSDTTGRFLSTTVGDVRSRVFNDFADLFYTQETYTNIRGYGAVISVSLVSGSYVATITNAGTGYTAGNLFTVDLGGGKSCSFTVATVNGTGGILTISGLSVNFSTVRSSVLSDFLDFTYPIIDDSESINNFTITFSETGPFVSNIGPTSLSRHNVLGQELLFTLRDRSDGDKVSYTDSTARTFTKIAVDPYPQGFWNDYNELTFGGLPYLDQELTQTFIKSKPTSVTILDVCSKATLGLTKTNSEIINLLEVRTLTLRKPSADTAAAGNETLTKVINKTAGEIQVNTWTDLQEFIFSGIMGIDYGTKYDAILVPDLAAKGFTKTLYFDSYVWRDYNDLTFATATDQFSTFTWGSREYTEITRVADDARRSIRPNKSEQINLAEGIGKEVSINGGDGRLASYFRDWLGINPIGEHSPTGEPIMDEELTLTFVPGSKTDFVRTTDSAPKTFTKSPIIRVSPYWSDFAELTLATEYDQELVQYQPTTRPETIKTADLFTKIWTASKTFNDTVTITDSMLLSKNGGPLFTLLYGTNDISRASESLARYVGLAAGNVSSYYSTWQDYPELEVSLELAQYYYRGTDSTVDIGKITDQKANLFTKQGGRTQSIMDYFFNEEIFYDRDLRLQFAQDYVTEIIRPVEVIRLDYGKISVEFVRLTETMPRVITKPYIGDTTVSVDRNIWNPLYIAYVSNYEEDIRLGNYPDYKIDRVTLPDTDVINYTKVGGQDPVNTWNDYLETARSVYDLTLLTYGYYGPSNNAFPYTIFNKYTEEFVYEELYELIRTPFRTEFLDAADAFSKTVNFNRVSTETTTAVSQSSIQFSPAAKAEIINAGFNSNRQFGKTAGSNVWQVWNDYNEFHPFNELAQNYPDYRVEYLTSVDVIVKRPTKGLSDVPRATDSVIFVKGKNPSDLSRATDLPQKGYSKILGDQSDFFWIDSYEVLSFDPRLLTFGAYTEFKRDKARTVDSDTIQYGKQGGSYRAHIWNDYMELENFNELTQYWPDYVTELILPTENVTFTFSKQFSDTFEANTSGAARLYPPDGYATNTPIVYFADDYEESIVTSTF